MPVRSSGLLLALLLWGGTLLGGAGQGGPGLPERSNLRAAAARVDITPPVGTRLAGFASRTGPSTTVRDPLQAAVLLLDDGATRAAIVTLDLLGVGYDETAAVRGAVTAAADVPARHVLVAASHTHAGPPFSAGDDYGRVVVAAIARAARAAASELRPVTLGYDEDAVTFNVNRRLVSPRGVAEMKPNPDGPVDRRVKVLRLDDGRSLAPAAVLMHATCHPNVFRAENTAISADFPGEARRLVERVYGGTTAVLFLQGPGGDSRPNLPSEDGFRSGDEADLRWAGMELGSAAVRACARLAVRERVASRPSTYAIRVAASSVLLPGKDGAGVRADLQALRVGEHLFLTIPGEPFVEYGFNVEKRLQGRAKVFLVGYANGSIGYICTAGAHRHMGYEPTNSRLKPEAEVVLLRELVALAEKVL